MLPVRGDRATLERALRLTMEQRTTGETPILLADCGLDETGLRLAQAYYEYINGVRSGWDLNAIPNLKLGER